MQDNFTKAVLVGILICLVIIAFKPAESKLVQAPTPNIDIDNRDRLIQIAPNLIGVVDTGTNSGIQQLVVFEYDNGKKQFEMVTTLNYQKYLTSPEKYGIPVRDEKKLDEEDMKKMKGQ